MTFWETFLALRAEATAYPDGVQIWMRVMSLSFASGLFFVLWNTRALWVVGVIVLTAIGLTTIKMINPDLPRAAIGAPLHLILWPFALLAIWFPGDRRIRWQGVSTLGRTYAMWAVWVSLLMLLSLILDARGVFTGG